MARFATAAEYERWFRAEVAAGRSPDSLQRVQIEDEAERFWSRVRVGAEHDYWQGAWYFARNDGRTQHARRWLMERRLERPLRMPHEIVETSCTELRCVRLAHLRIRRHPMFPRSRAEAISRMRAVVRQVGHVPTRAVWYGAGMPSPQALERAFGSVGAALEAAGLEARPRGGNITLRYSDEQILQAIREATRELGFAPTRSWWERERHSPSFHTIQRRFGSIGAALNS